ncbi:MAG: hypothetical protein GX241_06195 [Ruminococcaceae bacterium]|nr:hypothetical protein [Oscillospiraceae bacterium]
MTKAEIKNVEITDNLMQVSLIVTTNYNPLVRSPKVTLIFKMGEFSRFIPIAVQSYYQNMDFKTCTIVAEYVYDLENIFFDGIKDEEVKVEVDILYGEEHFRDIPLIFSGSVTAIDSVFSVESREKEFVIKRTEKYVEPKKNIFILALELFFSEIYRFFVKILGYSFIPFLLIDSLVAFLDLKSGWVSKNDRTTFRFFVDNVRVGYKSITNEEIGRKNLKERWAILLSACYSSSKVVANRITFLSNRREDLTGNFENIYAAIKDDETLDIRMLLDSNPMHRMSFINLAKFAKLYATSRVVVIDDFYELTSIVKKKSDVKLVQVWHACGAFKTFGFSRLGKPGGPKQTNINHRMYDRAIVSSSEIRRFYAEGFGIPIENVIATGIPRTDMFFDEEIKKQKREEFFSNYPDFVGKKIIMFAPTFRGNGRLTGYYPMHKFNVADVLEQLGEDYAIIVKHHPFVNNRQEINLDRVIDLSVDSELNDLLFVTDILITDYSSSVFEAALLDIPMILYAFDLSEYVATRDFYYEYETMVPGKIVTTEQELIEAIKASDFEVEKIENFKHKFFDELDGKSATRVVEMIKDLMNDV